MNDKVWIPYVLVEVDDQPLDVNDSRPDMLSLAICSTPEIAKSFLIPICDGLEWGEMDSDFYDEWEHNEDTQTRDYIEGKTPEGGIRLRGGKGILLYAAIISVRLDALYIQPPPAMIKTAWLTLIMAHRETDKE